MFETPTCVVDGCETETPGLDDGIHLSRRDGVVCNDHWDYLEEHRHLPDEEPLGQGCISCIRAEEGGD